jgi:hypothetical protein
MGKYEKYVEPYLDKIKEWSGFLSDKDISNKLGISQTSFITYKKKHPELEQVVIEGRKELVAELKSTLKQKARGFHYKEAKTVIRDVDGVKTKVREEYEKYSPPDTGAIHLLLKNLDEEWTNDDKPTMKLKAEKLELEKQKGIVW